MRTLHICSAREIGGGERYLVDLVNALRRRGHEVFAALRPGSPVRAELSSLAPEKVIELPMRNALSVTSALKLSRFSQENDIQIIHAHLARDYPIGAMAAARTAARLVLTRHVLFPLTRMHRLTLRQTARVIAVSEAVAASLHGQKIFPPQKVITIHNGIDIERFALGREAAAPTRPDSPLRVGTVGHLAPIKGQEDFIRAAAIICKQRHDVEFVIAGEDKSAAGENRARIEKLIRDLHLDGRIQLLGWVDDVSSLLPTLDLFISPAHSEPFGLSIVESMAASVGVVATFSEGAREIVEDNQTGRLVPIGDVPALAAAISELLADRVERARLARNALEMARAKFSLETMVERTEQVYQDVLAEGTG